MKIIALFLVSAMALSPVFAATSEASAKNFWQEFDISFWQALPFAVFWGYVADTQLSGWLKLGQATHWEAVLTFSTVISAINAYNQAKKAAKP